MASRKFEDAVSREAFWRGHVEAWGSRGGTLGAYCREWGLSEGSFYYWRKKFEQQQQQHPGGPACGGERGLSFVEVRAASAECGAAIEVGLVGGRRIGVHPGFDGPTLARVVEVLEGRAC
jgi:hypothetical protein